MLHDDLLKPRQEEYDRIKKAITNIDQQMKQLQQHKDQFITQGIEVQGALKLLQEIGPHTLELDALNRHKQGVKLLTPGQLKDSIMAAYDDNFERIRVMKEFDLI